MIIKQLAEFNLKNYSYQRDNRARDMLMHHFWKSNAQFGIRPRSRVAIELFYLVHHQYISMPDIKSSITYNGVSPEGSGAFCYFKLTYYVKF